MTGKRSLLGSFLSVRRWFQSIFPGITLAIGIQFTWFVFHLEKGVVPGFNRPLTLPKWIDTSLRSLKYLLAGFFIYYIFYKMPLPAIRGQLEGPCTSPGC